MLFVEVQDKVSYVIREGVTAQAVCREVTVVQSGLVMAQFSARWRYRQTSLESAEAQGIVQQFPLKHFPLFSLKVLLLQLGSAASITATVLLAGAAQSSWSCALTLPAAALPLQDAPQVICWSRCCSTHPSSSAPRAA